jgi:outer membrane protein assembly factor BamB
MTRLPVTLAVLAALACSLTGQSARFDGWGDMLESGYRFDPDERSVLQFSLQISPAARAKVEQAEELLGQGESAQAARLLLEVMAKYPAEALQVADDPSRGGGRWVGAGEWAVYQLTTRVPAHVLAELATPTERGRLAAATTWRDLSALRQIAWSLEGLPEGRDATVTLARLLAESGHAPAAAQANRRAEELGADAPLPDQVGLTPRSLPVPTLELDPGEPLQSSWPRWGGSWLGHPTTLSRLVEREPRRRRNPFVGSALTYEAPYAPVVPLVEDGVVYVTDAISVSALDLVSGRLLWHHEGPIEQVEAQGRWGEHFDIGIYATVDRRRAISPYLLAKPVLDGDHILVSLQAAQEWHDLDEFDGYPINHPLPRRRLVCLDRRTGQMLWTQEDPAQGPEAFVNRYDVHGPPVVSGGVAYVSGSVTEGAINAYSAAFDLETGELLWRTLLCTGQQELTMFNRPFQEHGVAPPALHDGQLLVCTNLGVVASLDAWSGRLRWITSYDAMERRSSRMVRPDTARPVHWRGERPFVEGDTLVVAPLDSEYLLGLDPSTGKRRWRVNTYVGRFQRPPVRHQAVPTGDGRLILVSGSGTECIEVDGGAVVWPHQPFDPYDELSGAAVLSGDELLVPADPWLLVVDADTGRVKQTHALPETGRGHLMQRVVPAGPVMVMTDGASVLAHVSEPALMALHGPRADAGDMASTLALGELALSAGRYDDAAERFEHVVEHGELELSVRARTGLVAAAWSYADQVDTAEAWAAVMEAAPTPQSLPLLGDEVLPALARLGAEHELVRWLGAVAEVDPLHEVELGTDGPRPVRQALVLRRLPLETPALQVDLLADLILERAPGRWEGLPLHEAAERRIDELLVRHGRGIYAVHEARAETLAEAGTSLEVIARLYPNAELVERRQAERLEELLAMGEAQQVFHEAAGASSSALIALRARAARDLGERGYADVLEGRDSPGAQALPLLPPDGSGTLTLQVHDERDVRFRPVPGTPSPEFAGYAVGCVDGLGELFCLDTRAGVVRWEGRGLPGGARSITAGVDLVIQDDLLLVRGRNELAALGLADGLPRWSRVLVGSVRELVPAQGLLFSLLESSTGEWRVEGHGMATGLQAFRLDLPGAEDARLYCAGDQVVCLTTGGYERTGSGQDKRLLVLDAVRGEVRSSTPVGDRQAVITVNDEPPVLFLGERRASGSRVSAWSPLTRGALWEFELDSNPTHRHLFSTSPGRAVLRELASLPGRTTRDRDRLTPLDAAHGPGAAPADMPLLKVLDPPSVASSDVVLIDPEDSRRLVVLDGGDLRTRYEVLLEGRPLPLSTTDVHHGADGFVLLATAYEPRSTTLWVIRGQGGEQRYSMSLDDMPRGGVQLMLVDGAVLLASGGAVRILRSTTP